FDELRGELTRVFPHVSMFLENHVEGVAFQPDEPDSAVEVRVDAREPAPNDSHFCVALCAHRTHLANPTFVYVPSAANVLRERQRHIALLERELATKNEWLAESERQGETLLEAFRGQSVDLERSNRWAGELDRRVVQLQGELERSNQWAGELNREVEQRRARVVALQAELAREQDSARGMAEGYRAKVAELEEELAKRAAWASGLQEEARKLEELLENVRSSKWFKLGRKIGMGPAVGHG